MTLQDAKARYANLIASADGVDDPRVREAFRRVPRERFLGSGPWKFLQGDGYIESASADPDLLYDDVVVALLPAKGINNGQPTLHARCLSAARVRPGERVLHVGCGSGYYTAVLSELVTATGQVEAWDVEAELVALATLNLAGLPGVSVALHDATTARIPTNDVIYVCASCTHPVRAWAEALPEGGRLIFPLTPGWQYGGMLLVTKFAGRFAARFVSKCSFIPCTGASIPDETASLGEAFRSKAHGSVASLHFDDAPDPRSTWLAGDGWWLSTAPPRPLH